MVVVALYPADTEVAPEAVEPFPNVSEFAPAPGDDMSLTTITLPANVLCPALSILTTSPAAVPTELIWNAFAEGVDGWTILRPTCAAVNPYVKQMS